MRKIWWFIILSVIIQEPASTDAAIFQARSLHFNFLLVNSIWFVATALDIWLGYNIGKWAQKKFQYTKFVTKSLLWVARLENFIGKRGENFAIIFVSVINFPYVNSFFGSWLKIPFKRLFFLIFIGDAIYWAIEWGINIGVRSVVTNTTTALYVVIGLGLIIALFSKAILNKVLKNPQ